MPNGDRGSVSAYKKKLENTAVTKNNIIKSLCILDSPCMIFRWTFMPNQIIIRFQEKNIFNKDVQDRQDKENGIIV